MAAQESQLTAKSVLVVEDEENLLEALRYSLSREGYEVHSAIDGEQALETARTESPSLVILDVMLPKLDGFELCRIIRQESSVPILMLTAKGDETDRVVGLELGADDYVVKPFSMRELLARVRAMLRRTRAMDQDRREETALIRSGDLEVDLAARSARRDGVSLSLKPREFELLALFATNKDKALTRDDILDRLWGRDYVGDKRTVDVHVRWLRKKIEATPTNPRRIVTVRGAGYRFEG